MPFNNTTKRFTRIWSFVSQFVLGENAQRSDFDTAFNDMAGGLNSAIAYLESLFTSGAATDLRYVGRLASAPPTRVGGSALVAGDFYFDTTLNEPMVYNGAAFVAMTDLPVASPFFKGLFGLADVAAARGAFGLGSAAVQNVAYFALAAQGTKADAAVQAPNGIAVNVGDWLTVHTTGTGFYEGAAGALNTPVALACAGHYTKRNSTSGVLRVTDTNGRTYENVVAANAFTGWKEIVRSAIGASAWEIATNGEAIARSANNRIITPQNLAAAVDDRFEILIGSTGYIKIKLTATTNFYFQWGRYITPNAAGTGVRITFPITFPVGMSAGWLSVDNSSTNMIGIASADTSGFTVQKGATDSGIRAGWWFAIGT